MSRLPLLGGVLTCLLVGTPFETIRGQSAAQADSGHAHSLLALRDSVRGVQLALNAFQRDLPLVGPETVVGRAAELKRRCRTLADAAHAFASELQSAPPRARDAAETLSDVLERLRRGLTEHCVRGLSPEGAGSRADTLRAWGPHRVARIDRLLTEYERAARPYARAIGVSLEPNPPSR